MNNKVLTVLSVSVLLLSMNTLWLAMRVNNLERSIDVQKKINDQQSRINEGFQKNIGLVVQLLTTHVDVKK